MLEADLLRDAYVYLLSRALVNRQELRDLAEPGVEYNQFKHNPVDQAIDWVNPNLDVANSEAWVAVDADHPVRLAVPAVTDRYSTVQVLDGWGETITNINPRRHRLRSSGDFYFVAPDNRATLPDDATAIVLRSNKAKLLARVEIAGDAESATHLQHQLLLEAPAGIAIEAPVAVPDFANNALIGVELFDHAAALLAGVPDVSPRAAEMQALVPHVAMLVQNDQMRTEVEETLRGQIIPAFMQFALTEAGPTHNNWVATTTIGVYGERVDIRSAANLVGIWANDSREVVYFVTSRDSEGAPLDGSASYVLDFAPAENPGEVVDAYWSLSLVDIPRFVAVPNRLGRFTFNSIAPPPLGEDGRLRIHLGPDDAAVTADGSPVPDASLLPTPREGAFSLTFRTYVPRDVVRAGQWFPPAVVKVSP